MTPDVSQLKSEILDRLGLDKYSVWSAHPKSRLARRAIGMYRNDPEGRAHMDTLAEYEANEQRDFANWYSWLGNWANRLGVSIAPQPSWKEVCEESISGARVRIKAPVESVLRESAREQLGDDKVIVAIKWDHIVAKTGTQEYRAGWDGYDVTWSLDSAASQANADRTADRENRRRNAPDPGGAGYGMNAWGDE